MRDVLLIGKVYEANRRRAATTIAHDATPAYDAIVLDAPPTGRVVRFLSVNEEVADLAKVGPIRSQADSITRMLTSPQTAVHVVTLLEEMPVQETVDAVADLRAARAADRGHRHQPGPRSAAAAAGARLAAAAKGTISRPKVRAGLEAAGLAGTDALVDGLLAEARDHALRVAQETEQHALLDRLERPMVRLPINPTASTRRPSASSPTCCRRGWTEQGTAMSTRATPRSPRLDVDALLPTGDTDIVVCCGSGGVGKTTTAAALGLRAAEQGRKVVVLTIDPARRLAQSMGLTELDNTPRPVEHIDTTAGGSLDAMMLDMKRTFDEVVVAHSTPEKADQILANPFYQAVSSSFAGTQEYMAMEKLGQLTRRSAPTAATAARGGTSSSSTPRRRGRRWTSSTPRSGSVVPRRPVHPAPLGAGQGRRPGRAQGLQRRDRPGHRRPCPGSSAARCSATSRPSSARSTRCSAGSAQRADQTYALLAQALERPSSSSPRPSGTPCARRPTSSPGSRPSGCRSPGLVLNRVQQVQAPGPERGAGASGRRGAREPTTATTSTAGLLALHADLRAPPTGSAAGATVLGRPPGTPVVEVPALAEDVHDVDGLRQVGEALAAGECARPAYATALRTWSAVGDLVSAASSRDGRSGTGSTTR